MYEKDSIFVPPTYLVKLLHRLSYSFLSIILSYNDFLYNLLRDLLVFWPFLYCFLYLLYLFMIISYITLLLNDNPQVDAVVIGVTIKPIPVRLKRIELDVLAIIAKVSNDFNIVVSVLYFLYFFWIC